MAAKAIIETHPIQAIHLGVSKSKAENDTSKQPTASAKWIANPDPLPNNTWVNTAMGSAKRKTMAPRRPRGERMPKPLDVSGRAAASGDIPTPPGSTLRVWSVMSRASFLLLLRDGFARR